MKGVIYIAGPYRSSYGINGIYDNIHHARTIARKLWLDEWAVICPHLNSAFMDGVATDDTFMEGDIEILKRCDAIYLLKGWRDSPGARLEYEQALLNRIEIMFEE